MNSSSPRPKRDEQEGEEEGDAGGVGRGPEEEGRGDPRAAIHEEQGQSEGEEEEGQEHVEEPEALHLLLLLPVTEIVALVVELVVLLLLLAKDQCSEHDDGQHGRGGECRDYPEASEGPCVAVGDFALG